LFDGTRIRPDQTPEELEMEDEDEIDARKGRPRHSVKKVDEETYKPRVYKWKMERKR